MISRVVLGILGVLVSGSWAIAGMAGAPEKPVDIKKEIGSKCGGAPLGIVELDGKVATKDQMEEAKFQVVNFMVQSDVYQDCVLKASAPFVGKLTDRDKALIVKVIQANQEEKEAVGVAYNAAVDAYNLKHPGSTALSSPVASPDAKPATTKPAPPKPASTKPASSTKPAASAKPAPTANAATTSGTP